MVNNKQRKEIFTKFLAKSMPERGGVHQGFFSVREATYLSGMKYHAVYRLIRDGKLTPYSVGMDKKTVYIKISDLIDYCKQWLAENEVGHKRPQNKSRNKKQKSIYKRKPKIKIKM